MKARWNFLMLIPLVIGILGVSAMYTAVVSGATPSNLPPLVPTVDPGVDFLKISLTPTSGPPGTTVLVNREAGNIDFSHDWKFRIIFQGLLRPNGGRTQEAVFVTVSRLKITIPADAACGTYSIRVFRGNTLQDASVRSNEVHFSVTDPCAPVPQLFQIDPERGLPGQRVTVRGDGLRQDTVVHFVKFTPPPARVIEIPAELTSPNELGFNLPPAEIADIYCGSNNVFVENLGVWPASNEIAFSLSCPANIFNAVTYNVNMFPPQVIAGICLIFCDHQDERAPKIPLRTDLNHRDVIVLEEAFSDSHRNIIVNGFQDRYPYHTRILGSDSGVEQDGGVIILSKWPITNGGGLGDQRLFGGVCNGVTNDDNDCLADKGVLYARIIKEGKPYHIFGTHLDSGRSDGDREARLKQLKIIHDFIIEQPILANEAVFLAGDLNIDPNEQASEYDNLVQILGVVPVNFEGYTTPDGRHTTYLDDDLVDYVFALSGYLEPTTAINEVLELQDLSDHHPVVGRFMFPSSGGIHRYQYLPIIINNGKPGAGR